MAGEAIRLGPFVEGLNTFSDPTSIGDTQLTELINFDLDIDGSLVSRPPFHNLETPIPAAVGTGDMALRGYYVSPQGTAYLIGVNGERTYYYTGTTWETLTSTFAASAIAQYNDELFLVSPVGESDPGGKWTPSGGFTAISDMPRGACIAVYKERIWIGAGKNAASNGNRILFCGVGDPETWPTNNFISINNGDGQNVLDITTYFESIIVFKSDSTYRFTFDLDPALGIVSNVSDTVGITDSGCFTSFENRLFVSHRRNFYELNNYNYQILNLSVPLEADSPSSALQNPVSVSNFADRIFVGFYDRMHVYSLRTRSWSVWASSVLENIGPIFPIPGQQDVEPTAYTYSTLSGSRDLYEIKDAWTTNTEEMVCSFKTKNYDYQNPHAFKRIWWWNADVITTSNVRAELHPIRFSTRPTWEEVANHTWEEIAEYTWGALLAEDNITMDEVIIEDATEGRKLIKFPKDQRFRQIAFRMEFDTDGSFRTAPVRVFSLTTFVRDKQKVTQKIN